MSMMSLIAVWTTSSYGNRFVTPLTSEHGRQCLLFSFNFSLAWQTVIVSTESLDFLSYSKKSFNSMLINLFNLNK